MPFNARFKVVKVKTIEAIRSRTLTQTREFRRISSSFSSSKEVALNGGVFEIKWALGSSKSINYVSCYTNSCYTWNFCAFDNSKVFIEIL